jgi:hypothetical protein
LKLYQLIAVGPYLCLEGKGRIHSKKVFKTLAEAEAYEPLFRACALENRNSLLDLESITKVFHIELELPDEPL